jgi:hypothetical protein
MNFREACTPARLRRDEQTPVIACSDLRIRHDMRGLRRSLTTQERDMKTTTALFIALAWRQRRRRSAEATTISNPARQPTATRIAAMQHRGTATTFHGRRSDRGLIAAGSRDEQTEVIRCSDPFVRRRYDGARGSHSLERNVT